MPHLVVQSAEQPAELLSEPVSAALAQSGSGWKGCVAGVIEKVLQYGYMVKKLSLPKWGWVVVVALVVGALFYSVVKPYLNWKTYTIDNFISLGYPSGWHFQVDNYTVLSGEKYLFLISDFNGELSRQDFSSPEQKFLIEGNKVVNKNAKTLDEYAKPFLSFCDSTKCSLQVSKFNKSGFNVVKIKINGNKNTFYKGEYYYFIEGKDFVYQIHVGYEGDAWLISNPLRKLIIEKIVNSINF